MCVHTYIMGKGYDVTLGAYTFICVAWYNFLPVSSLAPGGFAGADS